MPARFPKPTCKTWPPTSKAYNSLFLFGRDLRLGDQAGLAEAAAFGDVTPALIVDPKRLALLAKNPRRAAYYCGAVRSLDRDLSARGARLICRRGDAIAAAVRLARDVRADAVMWSASYDARGRAQSEALQSALEEAGFRVAIFHTTTAVEPDDTAAARSSDDGVGYRSFVAYYAAWSSIDRPPHRGTVRFAVSDVASDALPSASECGAEVHEDRLPSESDARATLDRFLAGPVLSYRSARKVPAGEPTSRLSAALSFGLISSRTVLHAVDERARDPFLLTEERAALATFTEALARRDFFLQLAWFFEETPDEILQQRMRAFPFAKTHPHLDAWNAGRTGFPLVDAGMRELRATGWMHPRVRLIAASFLCFDLGVDWRTGRDAWDLDLIEDDPALANGNWQWVAGVGADLAQAPRIFNPRKQAREFDPTGAYVRRWIPELASAPDHVVFAHEGGRARDQLAFDLFDTSRYPAPILDHEPVANAFLDRYAAFTGKAVTP